MREIDTKLRYLEARTNWLTDQMAQLTLNNQKENGHPHRHSRAWVRQHRRMGPAPMTGAEAQAPLAEGNNSSVPDNVPFRHVPTTWGDIKALNARAKVLPNKKCFRPSTIIYNGWTLKTGQWTEFMTLGYGSPWMPPCLNPYLCFMMYTEVACSRLHSGTANSRFHRLNNYNCIHKQKRGGVWNCSAWFQKL